jgi:Mce-associated membrane protein
MLSVVVIVAVALAVLLPFQLNHYRDAKDNGASALRKQGQVAANQAAVELTSPTAADANSYVKDLLTRSTGSFKDQLAQMATTLESTVKDAGVTATATVSASGVKSVDVKKRTVAVALTVVQTLKNKAAPKGEPRYYRMLVTMVKRSDDWLVSDIRFVA